MAANIVSEITCNVSSRTLNPNITTYLHMCLCVRVIVSRCCWGRTTVSWTNWCGRTDNHKRNSQLHRLPSVNHCRRSWGLNRYLYLCAKWTLCRTLSFIHSFSRHSCSVCLMSGVSQGSAAMCVRCGENCHMGFVGNLPDFPAVKEFWKSVKIWRRYHHELVVAVLMATWCILHVNECGYVSAIKCHVTRRSWRLIQSGWFVFTTSVRWLTFHEIIFVPLPTPTGAVNHFIVGSSSRLALRYPSVCCWLTCISHDAAVISLYLVERFQWDLALIFTMWVDIAVKVFKVRGQRSRL